MMVLDMSAGQVVGVIALSVLLIGLLLVGMTWGIGGAMRETDKRIAMEEFSTEQRARDWFDHKWGEGSFDNTEPRRFKSPLLQRRHP